MALRYKPIIADKALFVESYGYAGQIPFVVIPGVVVEKVVKFRLSTTKSRSIHCWIERLENDLLEVNLLG